MPNCVILSDRISAVAPQDLEPTSSPTTAIDPLNYNWSGLGWMQAPPASKPISSPAVRQKPETPEQWATLTEAWFVACEYKPTVEDFRLLPELLWENQGNVEVDLDC